MSQLSVDIAHHVITDIQAYHADKKTISICKTLLIDYILDYGNMDYYGKTV